MQPTIKSVEVTSKGWITVHTDRTVSGPHALRYLGHGRFAACPGVVVTERDRLIAGVLPTDTIVVLA